MSYGVRVQVPSLAPNKNLVKHRVFELRKVFILLFNDFGRCLVFMVIFLPIKNTNSGHATVHYPLFFMLFFGSPKSNDRAFEMTSDAFACDS